MLVKLTPGVAHAGGDGLVARWSSKAAVRLEQLGVHRRTHDLRG